MALLEFKCPNCGGAINFDPGTQEMVCPYCDSVMDIEALRSMDDEMAQAEKQEDAIWEYAGNDWREGEQQGMAVYTCNSCSGEIIGSETIGATTCPYCGNPVVMTAKFAGTLRPDMVIPFKLDKATALASLEQHYAKKRLLPKVFKERNHLEEVKGVYIPFWLYNADANAHLEFRGNKVRRWSDSRYHYTETSVFRIIRGGNISFDDVPVDGSKEVDDTLMESLEPFDTNTAVDFQAAYLAGFYANKYDVDAKTGSPRANQRIKNSTVSAFSKTVAGYTAVVPVSSNIKLNCGGVRYALLPVWLLGSTWEGRSFMFAMNGQTGKFVGDLPVDKKERWRLYWMMFGIIAASLLVVTQGLISLWS
jgi:DNA-directed RNA polymerase subunit RPC12/RpoP